MQHKEILLKNTLELCNWIEENFAVQNLTEISNVEDMKSANKINLQLSAYEAYFSDLLSYAEVMTRYAKRNYAKDDYEDMVDRKKIIQNKHDSLKHQRDALSRSVTIYIKTLEELKNADKF